MRPATGLRFTWQSNTLMKTEMRGSGFSPNASSGGGITLATRMTRPSAGERIGMIRFGSRVDVYLPEGARALVAEGQRAIAGETVLADLRAPDASRTFRIG